ncbi:hypothetical protein KL933_004498 [Ogataea haglerorum]|uniref:Adenosine deaminase domain-containing protein n=1 Tax=Ogataea haglerorum TaxID=1937702 RepID=A0AAN6D294_9ASCO|nr:hypothetical protein KL933_004498 [Ogataea haglerorum]KAG7741216.1 hypothetical protein KL923_001857 [Ogataea haglerorum]
MAVLVGRGVRVKLIKCRIYLNRALSFLMTRNKGSLYEICHKLPKVETHCHLYGTICKETITYFNNRAGKPFTDEQIERFYIRGTKPVGVLAIFRGLDSDLIKFPQDLYRITKEHLAVAKSHNVIYIELSWNPTGTVLESKIPFASAQKAIHDAMIDSEAEIGIMSRLICAIDRQAEPEKAAQMLDWMLESPSPMTIGIGIDYKEDGFPPQLFEDTFKRAKSKGYKITAHAGEFGMPWNNIDYVANIIHADRIDHGYTIIDNRKLVDQFLEEQRPISVVPTNSYYLRLFDPEEWAQKHPIRKMIKLGLNIYPNTDDPSFHCVEPTKAWMMMVECFGATIPDLKRFAYNAIDSAWVDKDLKSKWKQDCDKYFQSL